MRCEFLLLCVSSGDSASKLSLIFIHQKTDGNKRKTWKKRACLYPQLFKIVLFFSSLNSCDATWHRSSKLFTLWNSFALQQWWRWWWGFWLIDVLRGTKPSLYSVCTAICLSTKWVYKRKKGLCCDCASSLNAAMPLRHWPLLHQDGWLLFSSSPVHMRAF